MTSAEAQEVPPLSARRLLLLATGSVNVLQLPLWLHWFRTSYPEVDLRVVMTRSAERFVTRSAMSVLAGHEVSRDEWTDDPAEGALHVKLAEWADSAIVYPATMNFVARFAHGISDTPAMTALLCTTAPIVVAPSPPPGGEESPAFRTNFDIISKRPNVALCSTSGGISVTTRRQGGMAPPPLPVVVRTLEKLRSVYRSPAGSPPVD